MPDAPTRSYDLCDVPCLHPDVVQAARADLLPGDDAERLADIFGVLSDPTRLRLVHALAARELCVCDLANILGLRQAAVSQQLRLLRAGRIVRVRRVGRNAFYRLDDDHIRDLVGLAVAHVREEPVAQRSAGAA